MTTDIEAVLGADASLLDHKCSGVPQDLLHLPGPDFIDRVWTESDRSPAVLRNLATLRNHGRLSGTGYLSIFPVDQGVEHSAAASFAPNPLYFDPDNVLRLAVEGDCNAVATTLGVLGSVSRRYVHRIPFVLKLNHNEMLTDPPVHDQTMVASVRQAFDLGAVAVGATVYWGAEVSRRELQEVAAAFAEAHTLGMVTILWCYLRNPLFKKDGVDYHAAADLTGQANHLGVTLEADLVKQKLPGDRQRLHRPVLRQDLPAGAGALRVRQPDRPVPLAGPQLLRRSGRADQLRRAVGRGVRPARRGPDRRREQAGRWQWSHRGPQGLPAPDG